MDLFTRLKKSLVYENLKDSNDMNNFVMQLPHKLKIELSLYIYEDRYKKIKFLKYCNPSFISWICLQLRP